MKIVWKLHKAGLPNLQKLKTFFKHYSLKTSYRKAYYMFFFLSFEALTSGLWDV